MTPLHTNEQAREWLHSAFPAVPRETWRRLEAFEAFLLGENARQNLIARATGHVIWARHIADSAQLIPLAGRHGPRWLDLGSGAGFPGLIVAALGDFKVTLVESRRLRIEFLRHAAQILGLEARIEVVGAPLERVSARPFDIVSARAFAPLPRLLALAHRFSTEKTRWLLPKGRSAQSELEQVRNAWQGDFQLEPSLTDPEARIIVAEGVRPRPARRETP